jgi:hypothetical protein
VEITRRGEAVEKAEGVVDEDDHVLVDQNVLNPKHATTRRPLPAWRQAGLEESESKKHPPPKREPRRAASSEAVHGGLESRGREVS